MRGAVQLSIGFIVTVVIAVVLLSLALTWLRSMFGGIGGLTEDLTQQAQSNLREAFRGGETNFAIWPNQYELERGKGITMQAGIYNNAPDGKAHYYVINVIPAQYPEGQTIKGWVTFDKTKTRIAAGTEAFKFISINIPKAAKIGTYIFNVVACYDGGSGQSVKTPDSEDCDTTNQQLWGNPQQLIIIAK